MKDKIILRGIRVHNLKNIDLDIPLNKQIIVTGVSGSGKSSLAFDTLYAEGQRRYIESLSAYARQFLERMDKPDVDRIEGITPAIAIQQKAVAKNPRSTVATVTETADFIRVLFARIGILHCLKCGKIVKKDSPDSIVDFLFDHLSDEKIQIVFSPHEGQDLETLLKNGFRRVIQNGKVIDLENEKISSNSKWQILVDQFSLNKEDRERLVDSIELGLREGGGRIQIISAKNKIHNFTNRLECKTCCIPYEEAVPNFFSFNSPQGACPRCHGFGDLAIFDEDKIIPDKTRSIEQGAVEPWSKPVSRRRLKRLKEEALSRGIPINIPFNDLKSEWKEFVFNGEGRYKGIYGFFERLKRKNYKVQVRVFLARYRKYIPCPDCLQTRLNPRALSYKINGFNIGQIIKMTVKEAHEFFGNIELSLMEGQIAGKLIEEIQNRLNFLLEVGLDYITLDRITFTLSGGEAQRINLAAALGSSLVGTLFVLDEPSLGLHAKDNHRLIEILKNLKDIGNTVLVVEHDPDIIKSADYIIDLGPKAGRHGGEIMFAGEMNEFLKTSNSITAQYMNNIKKVVIPTERRKPKQFISIKNASKHNLKKLNVQIPLNIFTCVTGVSGSGKSSLIHDVLYQGWNGKSSGGYQEIKGRDLIDKILMVNQSPLSTSPRSIPATYMKAMDEIRLLFSRTREAKVLGLKPGHFSFNTAGGRCEECNGAGHQIVEMQFLSDVVLICEGCKGKRYKDEILEIRFQEKTIHDVLNMSVAEALLFFSEHPRIQKKLSPLNKVGLGYLQLGQPTSTLSGGESQRIKLAFHLIHQREKKILYLFDEPTVGLHPEDVSVLLDAFQTLVEEGHSVVVIEHNLDMIKCADYIIDLGPDGGDKGGEIIAQGTPEEIVLSTRSYTAKFLKKYLD